MNIYIPLEEKGFNVADSIARMSGTRAKVVGIAGSIRNRAGLDAVEGVDRNLTGQELVERIEELEHRQIYDEDFLGEIQPRLKSMADSGDKVITNSDALVLTALYGAKGESNIEFHKLTEYVGLDKSYADTHVDSRDFEPLADVLRRADGIVLGSPVYFGDRSSLLHSFLNFAAERDLLRDKVVGAVSCGSKRNGGQETTNIYALFENLNHGAIVVGNGPKTCQYGGTGWGGDIGAVTDDEFGLETSMGTGLRVSSVANLLRTSHELAPDDVDDLTPDPFTVGVIVTRDKDGFLARTIEERFAALDVPGVEFNLVDATETFIQACIGCDVCPTPAKVDAVSGNEKDYKCIIDREINDTKWNADGLQDIHEEIIRNDALVIAVLDTDTDGIRDAYQALLERTRYIRRDDWRLHNVPIAAYVVKNPDQASTYPMKILTSWMRHNTLVHPPIVHTTFDLGADAPIDASSLEVLEEYYNQDVTSELDSFVRSARRLRAASRANGPDLLSYKATGYKNKILDQTAAERM